MKEIALRQSRDLALRPDSLPRIGTGTVLNLSPVILELTEQPPSRIRRVVGITIVLFVAFMIGTLWWGKYDVVAVANGKVVPKTKEKVVQPMEIGLVRTIHVDDGQNVKKGDTLIELDPTIRTAELERIKTQLDTQRLLALEAKAMLSNPEPKDSFPAPNDIDPKVVNIHQQQLKSRVASFQARLRAMRSELDLKLATVQKLSAMLPILREKETGRKQIVERGAYPRMSYLDDAQNLISTEHELKAQQAAADEQRHQIQQTIEEFQRQAAGQQVDSELKIRELEAEHTRAKQLLGYQVLTAPVDGVVEQLAIHTPGGVVQPGNPLMVIIPNGDQLQIEAQVTNLDIGFVKPGQQVAIKFDAYPYQIYGFASGVVDTLSNDAFTDQNKNISFPVRVTLDQDTLQYQGKKLLLTPGMSVSAEITTTQRRLIDYVASVILRYRDESFRER